MPHSDFLAWLRTATLKIFYLRCFKSDIAAVKSKFVYSLSRLRRRPQNEDDLKKEDDLRNEDNLNNEDDLKNEDNLKNLDNLKKENGLQK